LEKIRIYDVRVDRPPHYDTFAEFHYSYHYGDSYIPHIQQEEPLKVECQHFIDCIESGMEPTTSGRSGLELVTILEAATASLKANGAPVNFLRKRDVGIVPARPKQSRGAAQVGPLAV
jgi:predicted dehydrogenase